MCGLMQTSSKACPCSTDAVAILHTTGCCLHSCSLARRADTACCKGLFYSPTGRLHALYSCSHGKCHAALVHNQRILRVMYACWRAHRRHPEREACSRGSAYTTRLALQHKASSKYVMCDGPAYIILDAHCAGGRDRLLSHYGTGRT